MKETGCYYMLIRPKMVRSRDNRDQGVKIVPVIPQLVFLPSLLYYITASLEKSCVSFI